MSIGPTDETVVEAGVSAERIAEQLRRSGGDLQPVYSALDDAIAAVEAKDLKPEDLLLADAEPALGFSLRQKRDGKTLWEVIARSGRDRICATDSEVRRLLATNAGATALVTAVVAALGISLVALPFAAPIVGFLLAVGIDGFCKWSEAPADVAASN